MESEQDRKRQRVDDKSEERHAYFLENTYLKRIIKENHLDVIEQLAFNTDPFGRATSFENMLATIAADRVSVYDNDHLGKNLDLMLHFINDQHQKKAGCHKVSSIAWLQPSKNSDGDAYIAVGCDDGRIKVISICHRAVIGTLTGHSDAVRHLSVHPSIPDSLISVSNNSEVRIWNWREDRCLIVAHIPAACLACGIPGCDEKTKVVLIGDKRGGLRVWTLPTRFKNRACELPASADRVLPKKHNAQIDSIVLREERVFTKSTNGIIAIWAYREHGRPLNMADWQLVRTIRVKDAPKTPSGLGVSQTGSIVCCGSESGHLQLYQTSTGRKLCELSHRRANAPVTDCAFSVDSLSIVSVGAGPHLLRWEYVDPDLIDIYEEGK